MQSSIFKTSIFNQNVLGINRQAPAENNSQHGNFNINLVSKGDTFEKSSVAHNRVAFSGKSFRRIENVVFSSNEIFPVGYKKASIMPKSKIAFTGDEEDKPENSGNTDKSDSGDAKKPRELTDKALEDEAAFDVMLDDGSPGYYDGD